MTTQNAVTELGHYTWSVLRDVLAEKKRKMPPLYFFLSPESQGSLRNRTPAEKDFVHSQQFSDGGACLKDPAAAWVSRLNQVPEEAGHLFALSYKKDRLPTQCSIAEELWTTCLHECFGRFAECLVLGLPEKKTQARQTSIRTRTQIWNAAHREGYRLGEALAELYFMESLSLANFRSLFFRPWVGEKVAHLSLQKLYSMSRMKAPDFGL